VCTGHKFSWYDTKQILNNSQFEKLFNYYPSFPPCSVVGERNIGRKVAEIISRMENYLNLLGIVPRKICALCTQISSNENLILVELTHYHLRLALMARLNLSLYFNIQSLISYSYLILFKYKKIIIYNFLIEIVTVWIWQSNRIHLSRLLLVD